MNHRRDIDGLRALAVLPVILYHAGVEFFSGGFVGVDIFFVISGFLITGIIKSEVDAGRFSIINFYERRARRILPAFFMIVAVTAGVGWFLMLPEDYQGFAASAIASALFASNMFFWAQSDNYFDAPAETKPLLHTWSLAVEEQFYLIFPVAILVIMFFISRYRRKDAMLVFIVAAATLVSFAVAVWATSHKPVAAFYWLPSRAWELMLGSLLALGAVKPARRQWHAEAAALIGVAFIMAAIFGYSKTTPFPGLSALLPTLGAAGILYAGLDGRLTVAGRGLSLLPFHFVGLISYSLYLWHWPLIVFSKIYFGEETSPAVVAGVILASFVLATLSWRYVEGPFRKKTPRLTRARIFSLSGAAVALTVVLSVGIVWRDGFPGRLSPRVEAVMGRHQYEDARYGECHRASELRLKADDLCLRGAPGRAASFVLIGDSHAAALAAGVFAAAKISGVAGYQLTDSGWRPTYPYIRLSRDSQDLWMNEQLAQVLSDKAIDRVVVIVNWAAAVGQTYMLQGKPVAGAEAVPAALVALAQRYPEKKFVLLEDTPWARTFGVRNLAQAMMFDRPFDPKIPVDEYKAEWRRTRDVLRPLERLPNAEWVNISDGLCDERFCYGQRDGETLYYDADHLTSQFAESQADRIARIFGRDR